ncbi:MAG: hypothetical protein RL095_263 [Verrucomicrobiota bacterium]|jgi:hypothetical protein
MNPFDDLMNDSVYIEKLNGKTLGPFKTALQLKHPTTIFDLTCDADDGDTLTRQLPNGKTERYTIVESHCQKGIGGISDHYSLKLIKGDVKMNQPTPNHGITIHGSVGNIAVNSSNFTQSSTITIYTGNWESLSAALKSKGVNEEDIVELKQAVSEEPKLEVPERFGPKVGAWIGKMMTKAAVGLGGAVTVNVISEFVVGALKSFYGVS